VRRQAEINRWRIGRPVRDADAGDRRWSGAALHGGRGSCLGRALLGDVGDDIRAPFHAWDRRLRWLSARPACGGLDRYAQGCHDDDASCCSHGRSIGRRPAQSRAPRAADVPRGIPMLCDELVTALARPTSTIGRVSGLRLQRDLRPSGLPWLHRPALLAPSELVGHRLAVGWFGLGRSGSGRGRRSGRRRNCRARGGRRLGSSHRSGRCLGATRSRNPSPLGRRRCLRGSRDPRRARHCARARTWSWARIGRGHGGIDGRRQRFGSHGRPDGRAGRAAHRLLHRNKCDGNPRRSRERSTGKRPKRGPSRAQDRGGHRARGWRDGRSRSRADRGRGPGGLRADAERRRLWGRQMHAHRRRRRFRRTLRCRRMRRGPIGVDGHDAGRDDGRVHRSSNRRLLKQRRA
jgi:hypothetical protein